MAKARRTRGSAPSGGDPRPPRTARRSPKRQGAGNQARSSGGSVSEKSNVGKSPEVTSRTSKIAALARRIAYLRDRIGSSQLEDATKISRTQLYAYAHGRNVPPSDVLLRIALAAKCDPGWLFAGEGEPYPTQVPSDQQGSDAVLAAWSGACTTMLAAVNSALLVAPLVGESDAQRVADFPLIEARLNEALLLMASLRRKAK